MCHPLASILQINHRTVYSIHCCHLHIFSHFQIWSHLWPTANTCNVLLAVYKYIMLVPHPSGVRMGLKLQYCIYYHALICFFFTVQYLLFLLCLFYALSKARRSFAGVRASLSSAGEDKTIGGVLEWMTQECIAIPISWMGIVLIMACGFHTYIPECRVAFPLLFAVIA